MTRYLVPHIQFEGLSCDTCVRDSFLSSYSHFVDLNHCNFVLSDYQDAGPVCVVNTQGISVEVRA